MSAKTLFVIFLTVLITVVLMQNADEVKFKLLFWDLYLPKLVILTGVIFLGIILGLLLGSRPSKSSYNNYNNENTNNNHNPNDTLSAEDRDYISD
ncbi:DUF1049 domain-containing protein [Mucilaginibacter arboris]|uniref:DUF1049 domain-containing protein n=1 Tax=Mucilaginibacter arboris TaxID=2682090 RepID=A0A7K1SYE8_9SPHI|nr:DUF1049 domain-containing protein [Mucilaginibacter arboris]MVN22288.1 DUF1049 domain-containing protein [Mucilaginibacter arboris]